MARRGRTARVRSEVTIMNETTNDEEATLREQAITRIKKRAEFKAHLLAYGLVNTFLVAIWAVTGAGYFWPVFPIFGWGIGVAFNAWDVYRRTVPTEEEIRREMESLRPTHG
jgi:uncharacterized membrane protein